MEQARICDQTKEEIKSGIVRAALMYQYNGMVPSELDRMRGEIMQNKDFASLHAMADWIKENVPEQL